MVREQGYIFKGDFEAQDCVNDNVIKAVRRINELKGLIK